MALEATPAARNHLSEGALEDYALGRLPHAQLSKFEEHLLFCEHCQIALEAEDRLVAAILSLAETQPASLAPPPAAAARPKWWNRAFGAPRERPRRNPMQAWNAPVWGAGLVGILAAGLGIRAWLAPGLMLPAEKVELRTLRGGDDGAARAKPDRPLELSIDFQEMARPGFGGSPYHLKIVDAAGTEVWSGTAMYSVSGPMEARIEKRLIAGIYWVRLYSPAGKLLREFSLNLG